jgi:hypothetical protein
VLREALGPDSLIHPLIPLRIGDSALDVTAENAAERTKQSRSDAERPSNTFSQHQNENVEMSVMEFERRLSAGQSLQLRLTLAEWQERNATSGTNFDRNLIRGMTFFSSCCNHLGRIHGLKWT